MLKNTPLGCFSGKAEKNALAQRDFAPCGFSSAKLNWRPAALSSSAARPCTPAAFGKAAKAFDMGLVYDCLCFVSAPGVFLILFCNDSEN